MPADNKTADNKVVVNPDLFDTEAAAAHLHLSKAYVEKLRLAGGGPTFLKLGRAVRYRRSDLDRWLDAQARTSTSEVAA